MALPVPSSTLPLTQRIADLDAQLARKPERHEAIEIARILIGSYRKSDAVDPDTFIRQLTSLISNYPLAVLHAMINPRSGLPSRESWVPSLAEVKTFCDRELGSLLYQRKCLTADLPTPAKQDHRHSEADKARVARTLEKFKQQAAIAANAMRVDWKKRGTD